MTVVGVAAKATAGAGRERVTEVKEWVAAAMVME